MEDFCWQKDPNTRDNWDEGNCNKQGKPKIFKWIEETEDTLGVDYLREVTVDLTEFTEVVEAFESEGKAENQEAFKKEEDQRDCVSSLHFLGVLWRNGDWHKEGNEEVDKSLVMLHLPEGWDIFV